MSLTLIIGNKNYSSWSLRPWLFGRFGIVDAMYAPVALRIHTYQLDGRRAVGAGIRRHGARPSGRGGFKRPSISACKVIRQTVAFLMSRGIANRCLRTQANSKASFGV
ncbi:hypothetical protein ACWJKU_14645 [Methylocaldum sp. MU1018]